MSRPSAKKSRDACGCEALIPEFDELFRLQRRQLRLSTFYVLLGAALIFAGMFVIARELTVDVPQLWRGLLGIVGFAAGMAANRDAGKLTADHSLLDRLLALSERMDATCEACPRHRADETCDRDA
jgi:hypothetical protein